jgi:hypothetical protein
LEEEEEEKEENNNLKKHEVEEKKSFFSFACHHYRARERGSLYSVVDVLFRPTFVTILFDSVHPAPSIHQRPFVAVHPHQRSVFFNLYVVLDLYS